MILRLYNENTNEKHVRQVCDILRKGGLIIYPTDTVYGLGCDMSNQSAVEKVAKLKGIKVEKSQFSFIFSDLSHIADYSKPISNNIFKLMKRNLPGPFTFVLDANNNIPRYFKKKKKTIGIRVPDNNIIRAIVKELGNPILSTSVYDDDTILEYTTDPGLIHDNFEDTVDVVIDGGYGENIASTVVDCTSDYPEIIRQGKGMLDD